MEIITKSNIEKNKEFYFNEIKKGKIFIYPTDTIYGIGCDALNAKAIEKIRKLKKRDERPFSVIVPNKKWIFENCVVEEKNKKYLDLLPGPYTLILKIKNHDCIARKSLIGNLDTLGIRIPNHWFAKLLSEKGIVFVTTSVNLSGEKPMINTKNLNLKCDYVIDDGFSDNKPSKILNLVSNEIIER